MNEQERAAFRAFVREHHPDRGGDPAAFVAGMTQFETMSDPGADDDPRYDAPVEVVMPRPFPVRVGVALIRTWHRHRHRRVQ